MSKTNEEKKKLIRQIIKELHAGAHPQQVKTRFKEALAGLSSVEIAKVEQELAREGMPREEIQRLCDVHLEVFREQLQQQKTSVPSDHPINILMEEHKIMLQQSEKLAALASKIRQIKEKKYAENDVAQLIHVNRDLQDSQNHYLREENVLFPVLEKHGIIEPPAIMWTEHDKIREAKRQINGLVKDYDGAHFEEFKTKLGEAAKALSDMLPNHFYKENNILFPTALRVVDAAEWPSIRTESDEIGYCCFTPPQLIAKAAVKEGKVEARAAEGAWQFETGSLDRDELEPILDTLPFDISFVDGNDAVKYYNKADKRLFVRTKAVLGRSVQNCHPQKSVHMVNKIVNAFKSGKKDVAEFWITVNERFVHIRYFAVRDKDGKYLGTMEVAQDLTDIRKLEGQRRLLDWEDA